MAPKKKKYEARKDDDWNEDDAKVHRKTIKEKEKYISGKYKKWWDSEKRRWKEGFSHDSTILE